MRGHTQAPFIALKGAEGEPERWTVCQDIGDRKWLIATIENGAPADTMETEGANARLFAAAPAFSLAWSMVPEDIKGRIFDALHKPDTEWVEAAIAKAKGGQS